MKYSWIFSSESKTHLLR